MADSYGGMFQAIGGGVRAQLETEPFRPRRDAEMVEWTIRTQACPMLMPPGQVLCSPCRDFCHHTLTARITEHRWASRICMTLRMQFLA